MKIIQNSIIWLWSIVNYIIHRLLGFRGRFNMYIKSLVELKEYIEKTEIKETEQLMILVAEKSSEDVSIIIEYLNIKHINFFGGIYPRLLVGENSYSEGFIVQKYEIKMSLIRGYFGELVVKEVNYGVEVFEVFLTGLFSLIDALTNQPLGEILNELPVSKNVKDALLGKENMLGKLLELTIKYEKGIWEEVNIIVEKIGLDKEFVKNCYLKALESVKILDAV